jgi:hypothetical protein
MRLAATRNGAGIAGCVGKPDQAAMLQMLQNVTHLEVQDHFWEAFLFVSLLFARSYVKYFAQKRV